MNKPAKFSTFVAFILVTLVWASGMRAQVAPPRIFFSDLESGPNSGGQNNKGAFVTIYGKGFGSGQGTSNVTVGGGTADNCPVWSDTKVSCQLGSRAQSGNIIITVGGASEICVVVKILHGKLQEYAVEKDRACLLNPEAVAAAAYDKILEVSIRKDLLDLTGQPQIRLGVALWHAGLPVDVLPARGFFEILLGAEHSAWTI